MSDDVSDTRQEEAEEAILREGSLVAMKSAALWAALEAAAVFAAVMLARDALHASEELYRTGSSYWYEAGMPAILFVILGGALGCLLGWRMVAASGLTGPAAWRIGLVAWALVEGVAVVAAMTGFGAHVPVIFWVAWGAMSVAGIVGITVFTTWAA